MSRRMYDIDQTKDLLKIKEDVYGDVIVNDGLSVSDNGDVTVGRDLHVEDECIISALHKIVDTDGLPLIETTTTPGSYTIKLVVDGQGHARIEIDQ